MALRLAFMGTPDFAVPTLAELIAQGHDIACVYSQPPRPKGRGMAQDAGPVHKFAESAKIAVRTPVSLKGAAEQEAFRRPEYRCRHCGGLWPAFAQARFWKHHAWAVSICMARFCRAGGVLPPSSAR